MRLTTYNHDGKTMIALSSAKRMVYMVMTFLRIISVSWIHLSRGALSLIFQRDCLCHRRKRESWKWKVNEKGYESPW